MATTSPQTVPPNPVKTRVREPGMGIFYGCKCERFFIIDQLYYCHSCQSTTCKFCTTQEIDSYYCPNCLENMPSTEAMMYKNNCKKCFDCPCCFSVLVYQGIPISAEKSDYYFSCGYCHWDSLAMGLKADSPSALAAKAIDVEREDPSQKEFSKMIEKLQKDERERAKERRQMGRLRRSSLLVRATPQNLQSVPPKTLDELEKSLQAKENARNKVSIKKKKEPAVFIENIELLTKDNIDLNEISNLSQRFQNLYSQPISQKKLTPKRVHLLTRRSKHCSKCDKLMIKPDLNPNKIEFKRQHVALMYVPRITIGLLPPLPLNVETPVLVKFWNPVHSLMSLTISNYSGYGDSTADVQVLLPSTFMSPRDHDDEDETAEIKSLKAKDDPTAISERKTNWVIIKLPVKPLRMEQIKFVLQIGVKFKSTSGDQDTNFLVNFNLGIPSM